MREFLIDSRDLTRAITRPKSVVLAWPFLIANRADDGVIDVTDYSNEWPRQGYFPVYRDIEEFRVGLEIGFNCTIRLIGPDEINIGKMEKVVDKF